MLKKSSTLIPNYSNSHCLFCHPSTSIQTSTSSPKSQRSRYSLLGRPPFRYFATGRSDNSPTGPPQDPPWPDLSSPNVVPTPYQILRLKKDSPYSKRRFYELVKIYHPDRNGHDVGSSDASVLPGSIKMERYRLIVTAHEILSDPVKRCEYDKSGAGWNGRPELGASKTSWCYDRETKWSGFDTNDSPYRNATWEDWEKWYQRDKAKQDPLYFSNGGFLMLVLAAVFLGGFGQSTRVGEYSNAFQRQAKKVHDDASKAIRRRRTESQEFGNRDERLQHFLKTRDPHSYRVADPTDKSYQKLLQEPEICMSDDIQYRDHYHCPIPDS
ncbi:hypothetical protein BDR22DRAFT_892357 [Usnea florida]